MDNHANTFRDFYRAPDSEEDSDDDDSNEEDSED